MDTGQTMFTIGAMVLLTLVVMNVNSRFLTTNTILAESKFDVVAISIATSMIEEASGKSFDAKTDTSTVSSPSDLTYGLGPGYWETYPDYNDFDDYNGLVRIDSTMPSAVFKVECDVEYVDPTKPDQVINYRTWHKKLSVTVTSESMQDTVRMSSIYSYFFFR